MRRFWTIGFSVDLGVVVLASVLAYSGCIPTQVALLPHADWGLHFLGYGLLAFFLDGLMQHRVLATWRGMRIKQAPALVLAVAGVEELLQQLSPRRSCSIGDFVADLFGVTVAALLAEPVARYLAGRLTATRAKTV